MLTLRFYYIYHRIINCVLELKLKKKNVSSRVTAVHFAGMSKPDGDDPGNKCAIIFTGARAHLAARPRQNDPVRET